MVALMVAAGEMLQHALSLLGLSYQHHHFQERSERAAPNDNQYGKKKKDYKNCLRACSVTDVSACNPSSAPLILTSGHDREFVR